MGSMPTERASRSVRLFRGGHAAFLEDEKRLSRAFRKFVRDRHIAWLH